MAEEKINVLIIGEGIKHLSPLIHHMHHPVHKLDNTVVHLHTNKEDKLKLWDDGEFEEYGVKGVQLTSLHRFDAIVLAGNYTLPGKLVKEFNLFKTRHRILGYHANQQIIPITNYRNYKKVVEHVRTIGKQ